VEGISYQLGHFQSNGKNFNYQTLIMLMIITENLDELRQIEPVHFSDDTNLAQRNAMISFFTFASSLIPSLYKLIFGSSRPRINDESKLLLQNPMENARDWFCFKDYVVIRVYGFKGEPFELPKFSSKRLFILEFVRQRLNVENDNFLKSKKSSTIRFNYTLEPFVVKSVATISMIDQILKSMNFDTDKALRYDPNKVLHQRRIDMNFKGYEAEHDEVLVALANTDIFEQIEIGNGSSSNGDRDSQHKATGKQTKIPTPLKVKSP
jgi:hypothetical protein